MTGFEPVSLWRSLEPLTMLMINQDQVSFKPTSFSLRYFRLYDAKNPFLAPVTVNRELHKSGDRSCMHIEFDITGSKIR